MKRKSKLRTESDLNLIESSDSTTSQQNNNVVPFPIKPGTPIDEWYKTASRDDVLELLNRVYDLKFLKGLNEKELGELLDYTIDTGGFGA